MARVTGRSGFRMRSGNSSSFKMMGSSSPIREMTKEELAAEAAKAAKEKEIQWGEEELINETTTETDNSTTTTRDFQTKGTSTSEDPRLTEFKSRCFDKNGNRLVGKKGCVWADDKKDPGPVIEQHQKGRQEVDVTTKEVNKEDEEVNKEDGSSTKVKEEEKKGCAEKLGPEKYAARQAACAKRKSKWREEYCNCGIRGGGKPKKKKRRRYNRSGTVVSRFIKKTIKGVKKICTPDGNCWDDPGTSL